MTPLEVRALELLLEEHYLLENTIRHVVGSTASGKELVTEARKLLRTAPPRVVGIEIVRHNIPDKRRLTITRSRITLKLPTSISDEEVTHYVAFAKQIDEKVQPVEKTLRGNFGAPCDSITMDDGRAYHWEG